MAQLYNQEQYKLREREIWENIKQSKSVMINLQLWDLLKFSKKLQRKLKYAKETRLFGKSTVFDYEPEVKGCCQDTTIKFYLNDKKQREYERRGK